MKVAYLRTSKKEQHPENQRRQVLELAGEGVEVFVEKQSAYKDHLKARPVFSLIIEGIKKHDFKEVYVWDLDRLYRNQLALKGFFELCKLNGCKVYSVRQQWLNSIKQAPSPWNEIIFDMIVSILGWMAEDESRKRSERTKAGLARSKKKKGRKSVKSKNFDQYARIINLRKQGLSYNKIKILTRNVSRSTIANICQKNNLGGAKKDV